MEIPDAMYDFNGSGFILPPGAPPPITLQVPSESGVKTRLNDSESLPFKYVDMSQVK